MRDPIEGTRRSPRGGPAGTTDIPELIIAPVLRDALGVTTQLPSPKHRGWYGLMARREIGTAEELLQRGMAALTSDAITSPSKVAEQLFRQALDRLVTAIPGPDPLMAYALDRVGLACQLQGNDADAEGLYLRSLAHQQSCEWRSTPWTEVTLLNLAILYRRQGKHAMNEALIKQLDELRHSAAKETPMKSGCGS
jgi:hypothetical protein